jgi:vomeronasal1 receptor
MHLSMQDPLAQRAGTHRMEASDVVIGMIFTIQTFVGILGNFCLLYHYLFLSYTGLRLRSTDMILKHLTVANILALGCKGIPQTMTAFGLKVFPDDIGCKLLFYTHRVGRGVSICSTCFLSVFQAITISPRDSMWAEFKVKASKNIGFFIFLSWILSLLISILHLMFMTAKRSNYNSTSLKSYGYCSSVRHDKYHDILYSAILTFRDVLCLGLMLCASGSMVFILYRHKQKMQHVHRASISPRSSPESRATKTILLLVSTFVSLYMLSNIINFCVGLIYNPSWLLMNTAAIVNVFFPTVSPFLLMSGDSSVSRVCFPWIRSRETP